MYEVVEHTADIGLRIRAPDRPGLFVEAARALFSLIVHHPDAVRPAELRRFEIPGQQDDYLLFDWLNELLYAFETERLVLSEFQVELDADGLRATARGEPLDPARHGPEHEVKAITYHGLRVESSDTGWIAELIVDI